VADRPRPYRFVTPLDGERRTVEWEPPYNATLPHHLEGVTHPTCLVVLLQFIHDVDGVFPRGPIIEQEYAVFVIEAVSVTDGEAVTRQEYQRTVRRSVPVL
jgi:hypothetical protein